MIDKIRNYRSPESESMREDLHRLRINNICGRYATG